MRWVSRLSNSRLSRVWFASILGRLGVLVVLLVLARLLAPGVQLDRLLVVYSASAFSGNVFEASLESVSLPRWIAGERSDLSWPLWLMAVPIGMGLLTGLAMSSMLVGAAAAAACWVQMSIAKLRVVLVTAGRIGLPQLSPLIRDAALIACVTLVLWSPAQAHFLPLTVVGAVVIQYTLLLTAGSSTKALRADRGKDLMPSEGLPLMLFGQMSVSVSPVVDRMLIGALLPVGLVSNFEFADRVGYVYATAMMTGLGTELLRRWSADVSVSTIYCESTRAVSLLTIAGSLGVFGVAAFGSDLFHKLYGFEPCRTLLVVMVLSLVSGTAVSCLTVLTRALLAQSMWKSVSWMLIATAAVNVVATAAIITSVGLIGVAAVTAASYTSAALRALSVVRRHMRALAV